VDYPARKDDIVRHAEEHGAGDDVLEALRRIEDREYEGPSGVNSTVFD
jgi:hypothetical protein